MLFSILKMSRQEDESDHTVFNRRAKAVQQLHDERLYKARPYSARA